MTVTWTPVAEILRDIRSSCDFGDATDWDVDGDNTALIKEIISVKAADAGFMFLVDSILKYGFQEEGAIGWDGVRLGNGHHRFVAAVLLGFDKMPTTTGWGYEWDDSPYEAGYTHGSRTGEYNGLEVEV